MSRVWKVLRLMVPAAVVLTLGVALWAGVEHTKATLVGWVLLMVVVGTATGIVAGAEIGNRKFKIEKGGCGMTGGGEAGGVAGVIILLFTFVCASYVGVWGGVRVGVVCGAWVGMWGAVAWGLRRWGAGVSVGVALGVAGLCMALPVAAMPAVRAAHAGSEWQRVLVAVVAHGCPFFPAMSALGPGAQVDWGVLAGMYLWSGLGQEVPLEMPGAWWCAAGYLAVGAGVWAAGRVGNR